MNIQSIVSVAVLLVAGVAGAVEGTPATPVSQSADAIGSHVSFAGKVVSTHEASIVGVDTPHLIVKLQSDQDELEIVDMGSADELKAGGIEPKEGQQLWVTGHLGRINDKPVVFAQCVSEAKLVAIRHKAPLNEETVKHADAHKGDLDQKLATGDVKPVSANHDQALQTVEGTVIHSKEMKLDGEAEAHTFAKLQTDAGVVVVDLGNKAALTKIDLSEKQWIVVTGYSGHLNDKPVIYADAVGNMTSIPRPEGQKMDNTKAPKETSENK